jgi:DNA-binding winged helix-turn-helix (wHTH) protein/tetratricopeptide (TPR) repeat protein
MNAGEYRFGGHRLVVSTRELWREGVLVRLPRRVFDCLLYLIEHRDRAVGRDELAAAVWGRVDVTDGQIGQLVMRVRRALNDDGQAQVTIRTITGFGYRWVWPVFDDPVAGSGQDADGTSVPVSIPTANPRVQPNAVEIDAMAGSRTAIARGEPRRLRWLPWLAAFGVAVVVGMLGIVLRPQAQAPSLGITLVLPITVESAGDFGWARLGLMDLIASQMRDAGIPVPQTEHALVLLDGKPASHDTIPSPELLAGLPAAAAIHRLIQVHAVQSESGWRVTLDTIDHQGVRQRQSAADVQIVRAARQATDRLLAALGRTPHSDGRIDYDVQERLGQARSALLANQLVTAHAILAAAPADQRQRPEVRFLEAQIDFRAGRLETAGTRYDQLIDSTLAADQPRLLSQILRARGTLNIRRGQDRDAERDFDRAASVLTGLSAPADLGWALNGRAVARLILKQLDQAASDLAQARVLLEQVSDMYGVTSADNNLGLIELSRLRPALAISHSGTAAAQFEALGAVNEALAAQSIVIEAHLLMLQWSDALAVSDSGWALRERVEDPDVVLTMTLNRARIFLGLGRFSEADQLLQGSERRFADTSDWNRSSLHAVLAERAWLESADTVVAHHAAMSLALGLDNDRDGARAFIQLLLHRVSNQPSSIPAPDVRDTHLPARLLIDAEAAVARRQPAEDAYQRAMVAAEARGLPAEIALVASSYGPWLLAQERMDEASAVLGRIAPWARHDYVCALMQVALYHARGQRDAWAKTSALAQSLAGERRIPEPWRQLPSR